MGEYLVLIDEKAAGVVVVEVVVGDSFPGEVSNHLRSWKATSSVERCPA